MDYLDLTLLKDWVYVNIVIGLTVALYADGCFFILLPLYLFELSFTQEQIAYITSTISAAELICRTFMAFVSLFIQYNARKTFLLGAIACTLVRFGMYEFIAIFF